jgi:HAD superfamily hydrolase (TIGR01549 family)
MQPYLLPNGRSPRLIIFDKDGTLLDFAAMWGGWAADLAARLAAASQRPIAAPFLAALGYDPLTGAVDPHGRLAHAPMPELRRLCVEMLRQAGLAETAVSEIIQQHWRPPDPATTAVPLTDLPRLFAALQTAGLQIGVATSDYGAAAVASLASLGALDYVAAVVGADENVAPKPAPEMIERLCRQLAVPPAQTIMVGDTPADMQMGRAAAVGLTVGLLSGSSQGHHLQPWADLILDNAADLLPLLAG